MGLPWNSPLGRKIAKLTEASKPSGCSKYNAKITIVDGKKFASKKEANRYIELRAMERAGFIKDLKLQVRFKIEVNKTLICTYVADFVYVKTDKPDIQVIEDVKGFRTREYTIKKKLLFATMGIKIHET